MISISSSSQTLSGTVELPKSKSIYNRYLVLKAIHPELKLDIHPDSDDTKVLADGLSQTSGTVHVRHAGTAMRFLTTYFASTPNVAVVLTGSERMQERPISALVSTLNKAGAEISYLEKEGFPPLKIKGQKLNPTNMDIDCATSSQYATSILLCCSKFGSSFTLNLTGEVVSAGYIDSTLDVLKKVGYSVELDGNTIKVETPKKIKSNISVESDWSGASYFYSALAMAKSGEMTFRNLNIDSIQPDHLTAEIFKPFGLETTQLGSDLKIKKVKVELPTTYVADLINTPDLAQTLVVCLVGLKIKFKLTGLQTLAHKETNRLEALQIELLKLGVDAQISQNSVSVLEFPETFNLASIKTYHDHRMAMAFAGLGVIRNVKIEDAEVVSKSFPDFWNQLKNIGIVMSITS
jgi:3-phosphoshikimate 1-carboxyvinyltransferase